MVTTLIITFPISLLLVGFLVLQSVRLGLKWQIQTTAKQEPTLTIPNPIKEHREAKERKVAIEQHNGFIEEWLHGAKKE